MKNPTKEANSMDRKGTHYRGNPAAEGIMAARAEARMREEIERFYTECPGCSADLSGASNEPGSDTLKACPRCGGLVGGPVTADHFRSFVKNRFARKPSMDDARYYDVAVWDGLRWDRFHGWFDRYTGEILQTG